MNVRAPQLVAVVLALMVAAGALVAFTLGGRTDVYEAPLGKPRDIPVSGAGSRVVELSADATVHPAAEAVRAQLQRHYDAINGRDYEEWSATVVPARSDALDRDAWNAAYGSTQDGTIRIDRIDAAGGEPGADLLVRVRFISTQDLADAPADVQSERICWLSTLPMTGSPPRIAMARGGSSVAMAC